MIEERAGYYLDELCVALDRSDPSQVAPTRPLPAALTLRLTMSRHRRIS